MTSKISGGKVVPETAPDWARFSQRCPALDVPERSGAGRCRKGSAFLLAEFSELVMSMLSTFQVSVAFRR